MSIFQPISGGGNQIWQNLGKALDKLIDLLSNVTELTQDELKAYTLFQDDDIVQELMKEYLPNKKHLKRKFVKEILLALKEIASAISATGNIGFMPQFSGQNNQNQRR